MAASKSGISLQTKAAAVMVAIGSDSASEVYKYLKEDDIEVLSLEISKLEQLKSDDMNEIISDFYGLCLTQKVLSEGGLDYAKDILEKAFGSQQAHSYIERITKTLKTKAFEFVRKSDSKSLYNIIQNEHPQTIALVLSYAKPQQASDIIRELPKDKKLEVVERIARLDSASPEYINLVEQMMEKKFDSIEGIDTMEVGGVNYVADIMNNVDRTTEKYIFDELGIKDPVLADEIRKLMFVFEDVVGLDDVSIQRFIREVDTKDIAIALKAANPEVQEVFFANMSSRMKESVQSDIEYLHNVRMKDVEEAQQRIVAMIRKLEDAGELVISRGGKDDVIV